MEIEEFYIEGEIKDRAYNQGYDEASIDSYNKAIDDFVEKGKDLGITIRQGNKIERISIFKILNKIAERLKKNENQK